MSKIKSIHARQVLDSRGNPTVEVDLVTENGNLGRASVPSGASTGSKEALELRDADKSIYMGKSVLKAIKNIHEKITPKLIGLEVCEQEKLDSIMLEIDGTHNKANLGANAMLAVSMAACRAGALDKKQSLVEYIRSIHGIKLNANEYVMPNPLMNIINGGAHASNNLDIQEFMIVPHMKKSFSENLRAGVEVFHHLKKVLSDKNHSTNVGDEGGFAPNLNSHEEAMSSILKAIENAGYKAGVDISLSLDCAASEFFKDGKYHMQGKAYSSEELVQYYKNFVNTYPIYSIEDGMDEQDHHGWSLLTKELGNRTVLVGDDLFVTNPVIFKEGISKGLGNAILIKVNQIGTLTETFSAINMAYEANYKAIISHRSGETGDAFIADLAVATNAGHIKTGSASRSDRTEKYNQLLRIEEAMSGKAVYHPVK